MKMRRPRINNRQARRRTKKRFLLFLAFVSLFTLAACGVQVGTTPYISENNVGPHSSRYKKTLPEQNLELQAHNGHSSIKSGGRPVQKNSCPSTAVVNTLRSQIGVKYRYGGATPKEGFDCSGLIYWAYRQHGISLPRVASRQSHYGAPVAKNKLQPGDIVAFRIGKAYHTGIYTGNNKFIHSPSKGKRVREDSLANSYWKRHYIGARRVV